jgi:hypothetical protein
LRPVADHRSVNCDLLGASEGIYAK